MEFLSRLCFSSSSIQTVYLGLSTGVYFSCTTTQLGMTGDLSLLLVQDTFHELVTLKPHQSATA